MQENLLVLFVCSETSAVSMLNHFTLTGDGHYNGIKNGVSLNSVGTTNFILL